MAGHSGAGAALSHMADETVNAKKGVKPKKGEPPAKSSALTADLVLYDAINGSQLDPFERVDAMRLEEDLAVLTSTQTDTAKLPTCATRRSCAATRPTPTSTSTSALDEFIDAWFARNKKALGAWAPCLRANYSLDYLDVDHEELMRGSLAGRRARRDGQHPRCDQGPPPAAPALDQLLPADAEAAEGALRGDQEAGEGAGEEDGVTARAARCGPRPRTPGAPSGGRPA